MSTLTSASIDQFPVTDSLTVHCFNRDGRDVGVGKGPLFIVREWDLKVIRTIGHKPKCKGPNTEQALRACVRQGLLSMSLKTENASKEEIQILKAVGVLGKRAPSGSLIGAADLVRLLEYFSKHDTANAFRLAIARKHAEGYISDEVFNSVTSIKERDIIHRFKVNTTDDPSVASNDASEGTTARQRRASSSSATSSRKSSKRKRRQTSESDASDSTGSSHSSDESDNGGRRRRSYSRRSSSGSRSKSKRRDSKSQRASAQPQMPAEFKIQMIQHPGVSHMGNPEHPDAQHMNNGQPHHYPSGMYPQSGYIITPSTVNIAGTPYTIFAHPPGSAQFSSLPLNVQQQFFSLPPNTTFTMYPASQVSPHSNNPNAPHPNANPNGQQQAHGRPSGPGLDALLTAVEYKSELRDTNGNQTVAAHAQNSRAQVMGKGMDSPPFLVAPTYTYQTSLPPGQQHQQQQHSQAHVIQQNHMHHQNSHSHAVPAPKHTHPAIKKEHTSAANPQTHGMMSPGSHPAIVRPLARLSPANSYSNLSALMHQPISRNMSSNSLMGLPNSHSLLSLSSLTNGQYSSSMFPSMSMTNLQDAAGSDDDDGDAGINGILHFEDDDPGSSMHRIPSIESFASMPRVQSNLSMLTNSMFSVGEQSRPQSPHHQSRHHHQRHDSVLRSPPNQPINQPTSSSSTTASNSTVSGSTPVVAA